MSIISMEYIRYNYGVPAKRGGRVRYTGEMPDGQLGTIVAAKGAHLRIRLDGQKAIGSYHPIWKIEYLDGEKG